VIASVAGDRPVEEVAGWLAAAGLVVEEVDDVLGTVIGRAPPDRLDALRRVPGVDGVEPERRYRLPPPDADVQ
jgi:hypothetical protein